MKKLKGYFLYYLGKDLKQYNFNAMSAAQVKKLHTQFSTNPIYVYRGCQIVNDKIDAVAKGPYHW